MATITKAQVDTVNKKVIISATSSIADDPNSGNHYRFTKLHIDVSTTFNCKDEPSTHAVTIEIPITAGENTTIHDYDTDLVDFEVPFDSILSDDVSNDLIFFWLEEEQYNSNHERINYMPTLFGLTLSVSTFYSLLLEHIKVKAQDCCSNSCSTDCGDVNFMLAWDGFNLAKTLQNYKQMVDYWKILHTSTTEKSSGCGCNR